MPAARASATLVVFKSSFTALSFSLNNIVVVSPSRSDYMPSLQAAAIFFVYCLRIMSMPI